MASACHCAVVTSAVYQLASALHDGAISNAGACPRDYAACMHFAAEVPLNLWPAAQCNRKTDVNVRTLSNHLHPLLSWRTYNLQQQERGTFAPKSLRICSDLRKSGQS